jgi:hypothetical protein
LGAKNWTYINGSFKGDEAMFKSMLEGMVPPGKLFIADKKYCAFPTESLFEIGKTLPSLKSLSDVLRLAMRL